MTLLLWASTSALYSAPRHSQTTYRSANREIKLETICPTEAPPDAPTLILLSGTGGLHSRNFPYSAETEILVDTGYCIALPHYLDATHGSADKPDQNYPIWVQAVLDAIRFLKANNHVTSNRTVLMGYSLGASVALAVATTDPAIAGVIAWSGSLPDRYFHELNTLPPVLMIHGQSDTVIPIENARQFAQLCILRHLTCDVTVLPGEGHAFTAHGIAAADEKIQSFLEAHLTR